MADQESFFGFAICELMGRNVIAGYCTQELVAGVAMLRVDVPAVDGKPAFTKYFGGAAIFAITPTDEGTAAIAAGRLRTRPIDLWIVPSQAALPMVHEDDREDYDAGAPWAEDRDDDDMEGD